MSRSKRFASRFIAPVSLHSTASFAPSRCASAILPGEVVNTVTSAFRAAASFTAM